MTARFSARLALALLFVALVIVLLVVLGPIDPNTQYFGPPTGGFVLEPMQTPMATPPAP